MWTDKMNLDFQLFVFLSVGIYSTVAANCPSFREFFSKCEIGSQNFDDCLVIALNKARPCLHIGDPSLNIPPLEPIRYGELTEPVHIKTQNSLFSINCSFHNITEWAWANSTYTKVKTDFKKKMIQVYQTVPLKHVVTQLWVHPGTSLLGVPAPQKWMELIFNFYNVKQRFTIQMLPNSNRLSVNLVILSQTKMLASYKHYTTDEFSENVVNESMKRFWMLYYTVLESIAYELSNKAKTLLGNKLFSQIDWVNMFTPESTADLGSTLSNDIFRKKKRAFPN